MATRDPSQLSHLSKFHITNIVVERRCVCHAYDDDTKCVRCRTLDEVKTAWPEVYLGVLEMLAKKGSAE